MRVNSEHVYRDTVTAHRLPQGISVVSLPQLALAFSQMAKDLRSQGAPAVQQEAFQSAIAHAVESAQHLSAAERTAVTEHVVHSLRWPSTAPLGDAGPCATFSVRSGFQPPLALSRSEYASAAR